MMHRVVPPLAAVAVLLGVAVLVRTIPPHRAPERPPANEQTEAAVEEATAAVQSHLERLEGNQNHRYDGVRAKNERALQRVFPRDIFIVALYRQWPLPLDPPDGLHASNVFAVKTDGTIKLIANAEELKRFFKNNAAPRKDGVTARDTLTAWLLLSEDIHQDGFYKFEVLDKEFAVDRNGNRAEIRGRAVVTGGGNGHIWANLAFEDGTLVSAEESVKLIRGSRPICQATKLLDTDPIVRKMAEQDLLFMGLAARQYLMEQRAQAGPELRAAIDRLWERIHANGW